MTDIRKTQSREYLLEAQLRLLESKPFDDVTVSELCETAGVSRQTFYRLYGRKEDILLNRLDELLDEVYDADELVPSINETIERVGRILDREGRFLRCVFAANLDIRIIHRFEMLMDRLLEDLEPGAERECQAAFTAGGMYLAMKKWCIEEHAEAGWDFAENVRKALKAMRL